jgi:signal transduction histidine kinase
LELAPSEPIQLIEEAIRKVSEKSKDAGVTITLQSNHPPEEVYIDSRRLMQVFLNLLSNGIKYSPSGTITVIVGSGTMEVAGHTLPTFLVSVTDSGIGLSPDDLERIFQPFERVDNNDPAVRGTGLGLSIARQCVRMHSGRLWAESEGLGKGSTFTVEIPVKPLSNRKVTDEQDGQGYLKPAAGEDPQ